MNHISSANAPSEIRQPDLFQEVEIQNPLLLVWRANFREAIGEAFYWRNSAFTTGMSMAELDLALYSLFLYREGDIDYRTFMKAQRLSARCERLMHREMTGAASLPPLSAFLRIPLENGPLPRASVFDIFCQSPGVRPALSQAERAAGGEGEKDRYPAGPSP